MRRPVDTIRCVPVALSLLGSAAAPSLVPATAHATAAIAQDPAPASAEPSDPGWGPIIGSVLGILFGASLAAWQIRGMRNRG